MVRRTSRTRDGFSSWFVAAWKRRLNCSRLSSDSWVASWSSVFTQLINKVLQDGKKSTAERIVYGALEGVRAKSGADPVATLKKALENVKPALEVKSRRVGGATYQVPVEVKPGRAQALSLRWLVGYSKIRRENTMTERLQNEILDASNGLGAAVKRREDTHKMAESNKAFAHYRW